MGVPANTQTKTVGDPIAVYDSIKLIWRKTRAICGGEKLVKEYDSVIDTINFENILVPFSPSMTDDQYRFYKAEAELPGIVAQYVKMLIGGLLRKKPQLSFKVELPFEIKDWIMNTLGEDNSSISSFLDAALAEELQTARCFVQVDYPIIPEELLGKLSEEEMLIFKPYPILIKAEEVINWTVSKHPITGEKILSRILIRKYEEEYEEDKYHPNISEVVYVHFLDNQGFYKVKRFKSEKSNPVASGGKIDPQKRTNTFVEDREYNPNILFNGRPLEMLPFWPLNGSIDIVDPLILPLVDKEIALYNKISRRNHLLYGAATYTPFVSANITDDEFHEIVNKGLGTWIKIPEGGRLGVLETPTAALADLERAIAANVEEMAKLGIRMLSPETSQSGVALELRNAAQTAQLGTLNMKVSTQMSSIIAFMINWRFKTNLSASDVVFSLSADFNPAPLGDSWLRLATEWYENGLIPRSVWLSILKHNDMLDPEYDDNAGKEEIATDTTIVSRQTQTKFQNALMLE